MDWSSSSCLTSTAAFSTRYSLRGRVRVCVRVCGRIAQPMDLTTIGEKVASGAYRTVKEFVADLRLVFSNCIEYWSATVDYAITAQYLLNEVNLRVKEMTFELTTGAQVVHATGDAAGGSKAKSGKKASKPHKQSVAVTAWTPAMQQAAAAVVTGTLDSSPSATAPSTPSTPSTPSLAAAAADFPSSADAATSPAMSAGEWAKCTAIVHSLQSDAQYGLFARPANIPEFAQLLSDYYVKVRQPNDLQTVSRRLAIRDYATVADFSVDVALIWNNAVSYYSQPGLSERLEDADFITQLALALKADFERRWDSFEQAAANKLLIKKSKASTQPAASHAPAAGPSAPAPHSDASVKSEPATAESSDSFTVHPVATEGQAAASAASVHIKQEGQAAHRGREPTAPPAAPAASASLAASTTASTSVAASGSVSISSSAAHSPSLSSSSVAAAERRSKQVHASGSLAAPPLPSFTGSARPSSPVTAAPPSPASLHRSSQPARVPLSSATQPTASASSTSLTVTLPSSRRIEASATHSLSGTSSASAASSAACSFVLSSVLPSPPKAKQRGGLVIKPLTAAQRRVRVSEVSRKVTLSAASSQRYWQQQQQQQAQPAARQLSPQAASANQPISQAAPSALQPKAEAPSRWIVDSHSISSLPLQPALPSPPPPLPLAAVSPSPRRARQCDLPVPTPVLVDSAGAALLAAYSAAGFHASEGEGGDRSLLCRARHCLLPATLLFPYHIDAFTLDLALLHPAPLSPPLWNTAALPHDEVTLRCEVSDRLGDCPTVMPSTARLLERCAAVALGRKRKRVDQAAASQTTLLAATAAAAQTSTDAQFTSAAASASASLSSSVYRLFPAVRWSDREQLRRLPSRLRHAVPSEGAGLAGNIERREDATASGSATTESVEPDSDAGVDGDELEREAVANISLSLVSHCTLASAYAPLTQLTASLDWHADGFLYCREQHREFRRDRSGALGFALMPRLRSRRAYLSCSATETAEAPLIAVPHLPFARLSIFCFAATTSLSLPGDDTLVTSPLHADGSTLLPASVCARWQQRVLDELRSAKRASLQLSQRIHDEAYNQWHAWTTEHAALRQRLGFVIA